MTPDDQLSAALEEIRKRPGQILHFDDRFAAQSLAVRTVREDVPRLLAAVDAVLAEHCQAVSEPGWCQECGFTWPCSTVEAITRALTGEAKADA